MSISRYDARGIAVNDSATYKPLFTGRNVKSVKQFLSPSFRYPTTEEMANLSLVPHIWTRGDRYWKLAEAYYHDPKLWFIIAWFNQKPTEAHVQLGEILQVPLPLDRILQYLGI